MYNGGVHENSGASIEPVQSGKQPLFLRGVKYGTGIIGPGHMRPALNVQ